MTGPALPEVRHPPQAVIAAVAAILAVPVLWRLASLPDDSPDLTAVWLAGEFLSQGRPDLVYPRDTQYFTMLAPPEWFERMAALGYRGDVFPFLYPPLWAWVAGRLAQVTDLAALRFWAGWLNPLLLALCPLLAWRIAVPVIPPFAAVLLGIAFFALTNLGIIALLQNQPQILVSFLTLLAIERSECGAPRAAGIALAVAAAIKLYPALVALVWLISGRRKETAAFALVGGSLAVLSVVLAGWPLHAEFLRTLRVIGATAMVTNLSFGLDGLVGVLFLSDAAVFVRSPARDPALGLLSGWAVVPKPFAVTWLLALLQIAVGVLVARALRRTEGRNARAFLWAASLTFLSYTAPVGWAYYYIAPAAFLPLLFDRMRPVAAVGVVLLIAIPVSPWVLPLVSPYMPIFIRPQLLGALVMPEMGALFLHLWWSGPGRTRGPA